MEFHYKESSLIPEDDILTLREALVPYAEHLRAVADAGGYTYPESSLKLPSDDEAVKQGQSVLREKRTDGLRYIVVVGIGGSNLGARAVYDALYGSFDVLEPERYPKMIFADTNDPEFTVKLVRFLQKFATRPEEVLINIISKSGSTTETIANGEVILHALGEKFLDRVIVTTDQRSVLWKAAKEKGVAVLTVPELVGGRYSVFSHVGLFPLAACGIDTAILLDGARNMCGLCLSNNVLENPAMLSAAILFISQKQGRTMHDNFFFHPELESLGKWYRQLMAESIGKTASAVTPTISIGSTDLHSMGQLYLGGPKDKITTFVYTEEAREDVRVPDQMIFSDLVKGIRAKSFAEIMGAILGGVKTAYRKHGLPFMEVALPDIREKSLGEFLQFKMMEIMYLGKLMNINAFDQPAVEEYKKETRKFLEITRN